MHSAFRKGILDQESGDFLATDGGFWELYEHARRLLIATERIRDTVASKPWPDVKPMDELPAFERGWERTREMQALYMALIEAAVKVGGGDDAEEASAQS